MFIFVLSILQVTCTYQKLKAQKGIGELLRQARAKARKGSLTIKQQV